MGPKMRFAASFLFALTLVLANILPGLAYNEENVKHIRLHALDRVRCDATIRIVADLTDSRGAAVRGATVNFTLKKGQAGDVLSPATDVSDTEGRARTTLKISNRAGTRIVVASVPGDGKAQITLHPRRGDAGCTQGGGEGGNQGGVEGATGTPITLPPTSTAVEQSWGITNQVLPIVGIMGGVAIAAFLVAIALRMRSPRRIPPA